MSNSAWLNIASVPPPQEVAVETIISDHNGERNQQTMILRGRLWWLADGSMYVYYTPTHWRYID